MAASDSRLAAVVDRIVPRDADPGALDLGTLGFVSARLAATASDAALIEAGLAALPADFSTLAVANQIAVLQAIEQQPWFVRLVTIVGDGFYADPGNGGNDGAKSWAMVGYQHRLPDGPSGPEATP